MDSEIFVKDENNNTVSLKIIMIGKEVGSIIGRNGDIIKRFREESGAKINISSGSYAERVITVTGNTPAIAKAFTFICDKIEEFQSSQNPDANNLNQQLQQQPLITIKLVIPAYQCGSLIGKGGSKIKGIRQSTGATIQVGTDMLPNSTERAVIVSGTKQSVLQCINNICSIMQESPRKTLSIPYQPKNYVPPQMLVSTNGNQPYEAYAMWQGLAASAAASVNNQTSTSDPSATILQPGCASATTLGVPYSLFVPSGLGMSPLAVYDPLFKNGHVTAAIPHIYPATIPEIGRIGPPLSSLTAVDIGSMQSPAPSNLNAAALAAMTNRVQNAMTQTYEMTVPNDLIGCIIGKGGNKIAEIRQISGATIRISNCEDRENFENVERTITITGSLDSILVAQYLITASLEQQKLNVMRQNLCCATPANASVVVTNNAAGSDQQQHIVANCTGPPLLPGPPPSVPFGMLPQSDLTASPPQFYHSLIPVAAAATSAATATEFHLPIQTTLLPKTLNGTINNTTYNNNNNNNNHHHHHNHNNNAVIAAIFAAHNYNAANSNTTNSSNIITNIANTTFGNNFQPASQFLHNPNINNNNNNHYHNINNNNITMQTLTSAAVPCSSNSSSSISNNNNQLFIKQQQSSVLIKQQQSQQQTTQEKAASNLLRMSDIKFRPY